MKKKLSLLLVVMLVVSVGFAGCTQKAASSSDAIKQAQTMETVDQKVNYLVGQANAFASSKEFDQAIKTAQYVLSNLDSNSEAAKNIIEKAKAELKKAAEGAVSDAKKKLGSFGQ